MTQRRGKVFKFSKKDYIIERFSTDILAVFSALLWQRNY
jgi:hypothetical protein